MYSQVTSSLRVVFQSFERYKAVLQSLHAFLLANIASFINISTLQVLYDIRIGVNEFKISEFIFMIGRPNS
jgi:hypothetical protein